MSVLMSEESPWSTSNKSILKNLESEIFQRFAVDFGLIHTKGNNFPSLKLLSRSRNARLPDLALAPSLPCLIFLRAIDVRPNRLSI